MTQNRKDATVQGGRRNRAAPAGDDALSQGSPALARAGFSDASLILRWQDIAGPEVARVAQPVKLQEGPEGATLTLRAAPGAAVLLQHETRALIERINAYAGRGRITRLRLVSGVAQSGPELPRHPSLARPQVDESSEEAGLEGAIARLARRRQIARAGALNGAKASAKRVDK